MGNAILWPKSTLPTCYSTRYNLFITVLQDDGYVLTSLNTWMKHERHLQRCPCGARTGFHTPQRTCTPGLACKIDLHIYIYYIYIYNLKIFYLICHRVQMFWIDPRLISAVISCSFPYQTYQYVSIRIKHPSVISLMASGSWRGSGKSSPSKAKRTRSAMRGSSGTRPMEA